MFPHPIMPLHVMETQGHFVYFMQGFLSVCVCVCVSVVLCFLPSYWLEPSVCLAKSCVLS